jgi:enamine deaminase RidA (YjgF/YER057c/UK114 family)
LPRSHVWPDNHWDWPVHLPYRHGIRCGDLIFLGGQVPLNPDASVAHKGDLVAQTNMAMEYIRRVLAEMHLGFKHVLRINTFYATGGVIDTDERIWKDNLHARFAHFEPPGPATTGIPMPYLAYEDMNIEIDIIAMV